MFKRVFSTKINVIANFASTIWVSLLGIIFIPMYLRYIGIEAYGLIGIFTSIQSFIALLDFGISPTLNRELARLSAIKDSDQAMQDIKRTLEIPNWLSAVTVASILLLIAPLAANFWLQPKALTISTVTQALLIMGVNIAIQFSINFYNGGLMGLQKQVLLSLIVIFCGTLRTVGCFFVLIFISPTIQAFLLWQGIILILQLILSVFTLKLSLPATNVRGRFQKNLFRKVWRYAAGLTGISIVSLILTQTDKIILSRMLNLETFGYYTLAITIASMAISIAISSITHSIFPQFSQLVATGDEKALSTLYHRSCQIISVILFPVTIILTLFSYDILFVWTNNTDIALNSYILVSLVAIGTGLNGLMWLPYFLQLAHGWTKLAFYINLFAIIILIPLIILGTYHYGAVGGAMSGVILNFFYILVTIQIMHRKILKGEQWQWYFKDLLPPFITSLLIAGFGKLFLPNNLDRSGTIIGLSIISIFTLTFAAFSVKTTRNYLSTAKILLNNSKIFN